MTQVTISGKQFEIAPRFTAGHPLTEVEAGVLNQTLFENIRNNVAGKIKAGQDVTQADVDAYAQSYEFGVRRTGSPATPVDPLEAQALKVAIQKVKDAIRARGLTNVSAAAIKAKAEEALADETKGAALRKIAKQQLDALKKTDLSGLDDLVADVESGPARTRAPKAEAAADAAPAEA